MDLLFKIFELIIGRLSLVDRIHILAVCKAWSVPNLHIPTIDSDIVPWAMSRWVTEKGDCECVSRLIDPLSPQYPMEVEKECQFFHVAKPCASAYGWVLFKVLDFYEQKITSFFLYSPFTNEVINLPKLGQFPRFQMATFSLNATSTRCVIFLLCTMNYRIYISICSIGDYSWKNFNFKNKLIKLRI